MRGYTLLMDLTTAPTLEALKASAVSLIRQWVTLEAGRTEVLRNLAEVIVETRSQFITEEGLPDWGGRSWEYRQHAHAIYSEAGVPPDAQAGIQAAIRYHVGNLLRDRLTPEELNASGLRTASPKERIAAQRASLVAEAEALGARQRYATPSSLVDSAEHALQSVRKRLSAASLPETEATVERLTKLIREAQETLAAAVRALEKFSPRG